MATRSDWLTVGALAVTAHAMAVLIHEAVGHGGACVLTGCVPQLVTSMQFIGDESALSEGARRVIAAGGSVSNLLTASIALLLLRRLRNSAGALWFFCWLAVTTNLLAATGYLLYSGVANIGDWAVVVRGLDPVWLWRGLLAVVGGASYYAVVRWSMGLLGARLESTGEPRVVEANRYSLLAYLLGAALSITAGLRDPGGTFILVISGVAASLGGGSGLAWGPQLLHDARLGAVRSSPLVVPRDWRVIALGAAVAAVYIFVFGPGVPLG